jgi:hypothetical protein
MVLDSLKVLLEMGFTDFEKNIELCMKHKCSLDAMLNELF